MMAMTEGDGVGTPIAPDPTLIEAFSKFLFGYCDGWVAVREFAEKGTASRPPSLPFLRADFDLGTKLVAEATSTAKAGLALFVVPGTVSGRGKAKANDVVAMQTVLVDLDHGDVQAIRDHLTQHLGPPSLEVASGGVTEQGQEKLHLYWKLTEPAVGTDIPAVCKLRSAIAAKVGGDPSFGSAHQPIRVPGSIYRKGGVEQRHAQFPRQAFCRLATQQAKDHFALATNAPALARCQPSGWHRLSDGKRGRAAPALASHRTNKSSRRFKKTVFHEGHSFSVLVDNVVSKETGASSLATSSPSPPLS